MAAEHCSIVVDAEVSERMPAGTFRSVHRGCNYTFGFEVDKVAGTEGALRPRLQRSDGCTDVAAGVEPVTRSHSRLEAVANLHIRMTAVYRVVEVDYLAKAVEAGGEDEEQSYRLEDSDSLVVLESAREVTN